MAEFFVSDILTKTLGKLASLSFQEISLAYGIKNEMKKIQETALDIKAVLLDAEEQQEKNHQLSLWLEKLKDVFYDMDHVLDEFECEALRQQVVNRGRITRKVRHLFSSSNSLIFRFRMGHKMREIRMRLDEILIDKAKFNLRELVVDRQVVHREREMTHSFVQASDVIGRDEDKENIVHLLRSSDGRMNVSVIPIVGIAGLGKTTLAKMVYNDEMVVKHFQLRMWVCVPDDFDLKRLLAKIIESVTGMNHDRRLDIEQLQYCVRDILDGHKYLLILDDVWNRDRVKWLGLRDLLIGGANGSKIVVTTRDQIVASVMGSVDTYYLKGLPLDICLSLLVKWAFRDGEEKQYPKLMKIGEEIVNKCKGVPLAVRTLGSLLYMKTNERDWLFVKDNEIWKLEQKEGDILPALRLSYDQLPFYLKQCFAFCSIFPKDCEIDSFTLIQKWMAHGFIQLLDQNQELEDIGENYIYELLSRSFFQDVEDYGGYLKFKMHDLVHDLALSIAQPEYSVINSHAPTISKKVRHAAFCDYDSVFKFRGITKLNQAFEVLETPRPKS